MENHIKIIAVLHLAFSFLGILIGGIIFLVLGGIGLLAGALAGEFEALGILTIIGLCVSLFFLLISIPGVIGGFGLLTRKEWGRILIVIVSFFDLVNFPVGTVLAVYSLWVLLSPGVNKHFE